MEETKQFSYKFNETNALRTLITFYEDMEAAELIDLEEKYYSEGYFSFRIRYMGIGYRIWHTNGILSMCYNEYDIFNLFTINEIRVYIDNKETRIFFYGLVENDWLPPIQMSFLHS